MERFSSFLIFLFIDDICTIRLAMYRAQPQPRAATAVAMICLASFCLHTWHDFSRYIPATVSFRYRKKRNFHARYRARKAMLWRSLRTSSYCRSLMLFLISIVQKLLHGMKSCHDILPRFHAAVTPGSLSPCRH